MNLQREQSLLNFENTAVASIAQELLPINTATLDFLSPEYFRQIFDMGTQCFAMQVKHQNMQ